MDGVLDPTTQTAIRDWQRRAEFSPTGTLTGDQLLRLRNAKPSTTWGGVAYTARAYVTTIANRPSRGDAEQAVRNECKRRQGRNAECIIVTAPDDACIAVAVYRARSGNTINYGAYSALRPKVNDAISDSLRNCNAQAKAQNSCVQRASICGDGSNFFSRR